MSPLRSLWRWLIALIAEWSRRMPEPTVLTQNPDAVPPTPSQTYAYPTRMEARDEFDVVRAVITVRMALGGPEIDIGTYDALGEEAGTALAFMSLIDDGFSLNVAGTLVNFLADGSWSILGPDSIGIAQDADGTIKAGPGDLLTINPDYTFALNGAQWIEATAAGLFFHRPTSDPGVAGAEWNDAGIVKISAG